jgi:hypothetical protein
MQPPSHTEQHLPNPNHLSVLTAMVLLAYALMPSIELSIPPLMLRLGGASFPIQFSSSSLTTLFVALLAASGCIWLLQDHPHTPRGWQLLQHGLLPALTAWVIGVPLNNAEVGPQWWAIFTFGGLLFVLVLTAEYITVEPNDIRHGPAAIGLSAVIFALYLILIIALRAANTRLYLLLPALVIAMILAAQRILLLRVGPTVSAIWAIGIALIVGQIAIGLHYLPVTPIEYGLLLTALAYAITSFITGWLEERSSVGLWLEPALMGAALVLIAILV